MAATDRNGWTRPYRLWYARHRPHVESHTNENSGDDDVNARSFAGHALTCRCAECCEDERLRRLKITHDAPTNALDAQSVSLRELVDNATLTTPPRYTIGEDWNDD